MGSLRTMLQSEADRLERLAEVDRRHPSPDSATNLRAAALDLVSLVRLLEPPAPRIGVVVEVEDVRRLAVLARSIDRASIDGSRISGFIADLVVIVDRIADGDRVQLGVDRE